MNKNKITGIISTGFFLKNNTCNTRVEGIICFQSGWRPEDVLVLTMNWLVNWIRDSLLILIMSKNQKQLGTFVHSRTYIQHFWHEMPPANIRTVRSDWYRPIFDAGRSSVGANVNRMYECSLHTSHDLDPVELSWISDYNSTSLKTHLFCVSDKLSFIPTAE